MSGPKRTPAGDPPPKGPGANGITRGQLAVLRFAAEQKFVHFDEALTPENLAAMPEFEGVGAATIAGWSTQGGWNAKRRAYLGRLRQKLEDRIGEQVVQQLRADLALYDQLRAQFAAYILPDPETGRVRAEPKSPEAAVMALLKIGDARAKVRDELAKYVGAGVGPARPGGATSGPEGVHAELSAEEAQRMAHLLLAAPPPENAPAPAPPAGSVVEAVLAPPAPPPAPPPQPSPPASLPAAKST